MDKGEYLTKLRHQVEMAGYDNVYITLCTTYADQLLSNDLPVIFDSAHLAGLLGKDSETINKMIFSSQYYYSEAHIPKKSGGERILHIPALELKQIQRWIVDNILKRIPISNFATGFCDGSSIVKNAQPHLGKECVINLDIKDFFPSVSFKRVFRIFNYYGYTKEVSFYLARLCTYQNELPQGSPASPWLSNIVCLKLDKRLSTLAVCYKASYTRYADDITFSGSRHIKNLVKITQDILKDEGFMVNEKKVRIAYVSDRQEVTGLIVNNDSVRVDKRYKRSVWQEIYYCKKYGVSDHMQYTKCDRTFYKEHLYGKAFFINMVEPSEGKKIFDELDQIDWDY